MNLEIGVLVTIGLALAGGLGALVVKMPDFYIDRLFHRLIHAGFVLGAFGIGALWGKLYPRIGMPVALTSIGVMGVLCGLYLLALMLRDHQRASERNRQDRSQP